MYISVIQSMWVASDKDSKKQYKDSVTIFTAEDTPLGRIEAEEKLDEYRKDMSGTEFRIVRTEYRPGTSSYGTNRKMRRSKATREAFKRKTKDRLQVDREIKKLLAKREERLDTEDE